MEQRSRTDAQSAQATHSMGAAAVLDRVPTGAAPIMPECFRLLMARLRERCPDARDELFARFQPGLLAAVRQLLKRCPCLRRIYDAGTSCRRSGRGSSRWLALLPDFSVPAELEAFLIEMARDRLLNERRRLVTQKPAAESAPCRSTVLLTVAGATADRQPSPLETAISQEQLDRVLDARPAQQRRILYLYLAGRSFGEIAATVARSKSQVRRVLADIRRDLCDSPAG